MTTGHRFILKPSFSNFKDLKLQPKDLLTYITIRSFYNTTDKYCYPSIRTLAKRSGLSPKFIGDSIQRLMTMEGITVWKVGKGRRFAYWYMFTDRSPQQKIPFQLLSDTELTTQLKATLLLLAGYVAGGQSIQSLDEIATETGVSIRSIKTDYQALRLKGYVSDVMYEDPLTDTLHKRFKFADKLNWSNSLYRTEQPTTDVGMAMVNVFSNMLKAKHKYINNQQ